MLPNNAPNLFIELRIRNGGDPWGDAWLGTGRHQFGSGLHRINAFIKNLSDRQRVV
jgi:hypothetical protein